MNKVIKICVEFLNIKRPYQVVLQTSLKNSDWFAYHTASIDDNGKILKHIIKITMQDIDKYDLNTIIAHEFIHAWQLENGITGKMHGKRFQNMAEELQDELESYGYILDPIYREDIDSTVI
jgi:hypothetical protein